MEVSVVQGGSKDLARISHKFSTALRNIRLHILRRDKVGTGADLVGFATLQGVEPHRKELEEALDALVEGETVALRKTRAIGCYIGE